MSIQKILSAISPLKLAEKINEIIEGLISTDSSLSSHIGDRANPHSVTAAQVGADAKGSAATVQENLDTHEGDSTAHVAAAERTAWNAKQDALEFDSSPTQNSTNPVTSGGVATALSAKADSSDLTAHTSDSDIHIGVAERGSWNAKANASDLTSHIEDTAVHITSDERIAWNDKQDALTFDSTPTAGSTNPVTSGGVAAALSYKEESGAAASVQSNLDTHTGDSDIHVTTTEKSTWNNKVGTAEFSAHTGNTTAHVTSSERTAWNAKANASDLTSHTGNTTVHITAAERTAWNAKASKTVYTASTGTSWSGSAAPYTQTITISGILASDNILWDVNMTSLSASADMDTALENVAKIYDIRPTAANTLTVRAKESIGTAIPIVVEVVR